MARSQRNREELYRQQSSSITDPSSASQKLIPVGDKKIIGFWHICMINDYMDIISEQLSILLKSGLYESTEYISGKSVV